MSEETRANEMVELGVPIRMPLSEGVLTELKNPWAYLSYKAEFYILWPQFQAAHRRLQEITTLLKILPPAARQKFEDNVELAALLDALRASVFLGQRADLKWPEKVFYLESELDPNLVAWGREVSDIIDKIPVLSDVWGARLADLTAKAQSDFDVTFRVHTSMYPNLNDDQSNALVLLCKATNALGVTSLEAVERARDAARPFWDDNSPSDPEVMRQAIDSYFEENKDRIAELEQQSNLAFTRWKDLRGNKPKEETTATGRLAERQPEFANMPRAATSTESNSPYISLQQEGESMDKKKAEEANKKEENKFTDVAVMFSESQDRQHIVLPQGMSYREGRRWLAKIEEEESRSFKFEYKFRGWYPFDAMWAVYRALGEIFGFTHVGEFVYQTWMGEKREPPSTTTIAVAYNQTKQIPWGPLEVHGLLGPLTPSIVFDRGLPCLNLSADIKNSERTLADKIVQRAEALLRSSSLYRGKAVEVDFTVFNPNSIMFDTERAPRFMDVKIEEADIILPREAFNLIDTALWTPIRHADLCREHGIPLRRGVLLAGRYGVGKTLAARVTAMLAEKHGWTFLYLRDLQQFESALQFSRRYGPCVIFAEDINRVVSGDRDAAMDKLFNLLDGIDNKNDEVMVVFTTNDLDDIHAGMLRPGRIDSVIVVPEPDAEAASRLVRLYGRAIIDPNADLTSVGELLAGQIPAIIREAVERSKLAAIRDTEPGHRLVVRAHHLEIAARQMLQHAELLAEPEPPKPDLQILGEAIGKIIVSGARDMWIDDDEDDSTNPSELSASEASKGLVKRVLDRAGRPNGRDTSVAE